jgi:ribonuclease VapC
LIVDASAIVATLLAEPAGEAIGEVLATERDAAVPAHSLVEASMVMTSRIGPAGRQAVRGLVAELELAVVPFEERHWVVAVDAFERFGKGRHPAALNFGDCLTYAVAHVTQRPLLCVGDDFARTDLDVVRLDGA